MTQTNIVQLMERHRAFWAMGEVARPLMRVTPMSGSPRRARPPAACPFTEGVEVTPEMVEPQAFVSTRQAPMSLVNGDYFRAAAPRDFCWMEAIIGCPIRFSSGSPWSEPFLTDDWDRHEDLRLTPNNKWSERLTEFTRLLVENSNDSYLVTQPLLRGPIDMAAAAIGDERLCTAVYDSPEELKLLLEICADAFIKTCSAILDIIPSFDAGYLSAFNIWAPGTTLRTQADNAILYSPQIYREFVLPQDRRIAESTDYSLIHLHSGSLHVIDDMLEIDGLGAVQVSLDFPAGPTMMELLPVLKKINARKPLIITGPVNEVELREMLTALSPRGLSLDVQQWG